MQYAHARIHSIIRKAKDEGFVPADTIAHLSEESEIDLLKKLGEFSDVLELCARQLDPATLPRYMQDLAALFHKFYDRCRVIDADKILASERLALIDAVRVVLANGLGILGISAPEKM